MRCIIKRLTLLAAALMLIAVPVFAAEGTMDQMGQGQQEGKDVCLLVASSCPVQEDAIQLRIDRIQREIDKGNAVYTNDELKTLQRDLNNEMKTLNDRYIGG